MPLSFLISYLKEYTEKIIFIGIQPKTIDFSDSISPEVLISKDAVLKILKNKLFHEIEEL